MKRMLIKIIIVLVLYSVVSMLMCSCDAKVDDAIYKECKQYILNKNSKKIHISSCNSAIIMSNRNKKEVEDSLENLLDNGYSICKNCNAGIKKIFIFNLREPLISRLLQNLFCKKAELLGVP